jgi:hypothetical protein
VILLTDDIRTLTHSVNQSESPQILQLFRVSEFCHSVFQPDITPLMKLGSCSVSHLISDRERERERVCLSHSAIYTVYQHKLSSQSFGQAANSVCNDRFSTTHMRICSFPFSDIQNVHAGGVGKSSVSSGNCANSVWPVTTAPAH